MSGSAVSLVLRRARLAPLAMAALLLLAAGSASAQSQVIRNIPVNTWTRLDRGGLSAPGGILAYSGMSFDARHRKLCVFGGGHADYWGNEVWAFSVDSLTWRRMYEPDPASAYTGTYIKSNYPGALFYPDPNEPLSQARPMSRHTYDSVEYIDALDETIIFCGYTYDAIWSYPEQYNPSDTWLYSLDTNLWTWRNVSRQPEPGGGGHSAAYDPETHTVYAVGSDDATWSYNVDTDTWTKLQDNATNGANALTGIHTVMTYTSPQKKKIYLFGSEYPTTNELWEFDIPTKTWRLLSPGGDVPPASGRYGLVYDSVDDVLIAFGGGGPNESGAATWTYVYDFATNQWHQVASTANGPTSIDASTFGRFKYDPVNNAAFLVTLGPGHVIETWVYRYGPGTPPPPDTTPPDPPGSVTAR